MIAANIFNKNHIPDLINGVYLSSEKSTVSDQEETNKAFSEKWNKKDQKIEDEDDAYKAMQFKWYLSLYGFDGEDNLFDFLSGKKIILDAGCGIGYKAAWFAKMNPEALVVAMDYSDAIFLAQKRYSNVSNMIFVKGDVAKTDFMDGIFDFINCDQVLHHTQSPPATLCEFNRICSSSATLNTYVYAKKALPRELLDEHFREYSKELSHQQLWELSEQLSVLGKLLSELKIKINVPDMPTLGIKGGEQDLQRFIYWNFIKCFWNTELGSEASTSTNFDWYSPSQAFRYNQEEFINMVSESGFRPDYLHSEEACHSGRFSICAE